MKYILAVLIIYLSCNVATAENLKCFYRNAEGVGNDDVDIYYDKDSINYPEKKKSFFGEKPNKAIIEVWEVMKFLKSKTEIKTFKRLNCDTRELILKAMIANGTYAYPPQIGRTYPIEPKTTDEKLFKILCR